jgi:maltooligosyltrehalose trehalohydrolase
MGEEYDETRPFPYFCSFEDAQIAEAARRGRRREFAYEGTEDEVPDPQAQETFNSAKLSWSWPDGTRQSGLRRLYARLLRMRRCHFPLAKSVRHRAGLLKQSDGAFILRLDRTISSDDGDSQLVAFFNLDSQPRCLREGERPNARLLLQSEDPQFGGTRGNLGADDVLLPFEFWIFGPSRWSAR